MKPGSEMPGFILLTNRAIFHTLALSNITHWSILAVLAGQAFSSLLLTMLPDKFYFQSRYSARGKIEQLTSSRSPKGDGIPTFARRVSCFVKLRLPSLPFRFGLDLLSTGLCIPQALRYEEPFFFSQTKPESERRGGFLPITSR